MLVLHCAELRDRVDRLVEVLGRDHEADHTRADAVIGQLRVHLGVGAGDESLLELDELTHVSELGVERAGRDADSQLRLPDDEQTLDRHRHRLVRRVIRLTRRDGGGRLVRGLLGRTVGQGKGLVGLGARRGFAAGDGGGEDHGGDEQLFHDSRNDGWPST